MSQRHREKGDDRIIVLQRLIVTWNVAAQPMDLNVQRDTVRKWNEVSGECEQLCLCSSKVDVP